MTLSLAWTATILCAVAGTFVSVRLVETLRPAVGRTSRSTALLGALASAVLLAGLAAVYRIEAVAEADGRVIKVLSGMRGEALVQVCRVVTTMGDAVPSLTLAGVLALWLLRVPGTGYWPLILPVVVFVELLLQFGFAHAFDPLTLADVSPDTVVDGSGSIPSGAVARLLSLFLVAATIQHRSSRSAARSDWLPTLGSCLVLVELVTRLLLGRHLLADIVGGLLLGIVLALAAGALVGLGQADPVAARSARSREKNGLSPRDSTA
jgi:membrane-associated phospholipid phosphatase